MSHSLYILLLSHKDSLLFNCLPDMYWWNPPCSRSRSTLLSLYISCSCRGCNIHRSPFLSPHVGGFPSTLYINCMVISQFFIQTIYVMFLPCYTKRQTTEDIIRGRGFNAEVYRRDNVLCACGCSIDNWLSNHASMVHVARYRYTAWMCVFSAW